MTPAESTIPRLLSIREASKLLRVGESKVRRLCFEGRLDGYSIGGTMRVSEQSIERYLRECAVGPRSFRR